MADAAEATNLPSVFDFSSDISEQEAPPPLPVGKYLGTITEAMAKISQTSGNTYADIKFTIAPDQFPADFSAIQQDAVNMHMRTLVMKDDARSRYNIRRFCEAVRCPVSRQFDLNALIGKSAILEIGHREYQGTPQAEIKKVEPA